MPEIGVSLYRVSARRMYHVMRRPQLSARDLGQRFVHEMLSIMERRGLRHERWGVDRCGGTEQIPGADRRSGAVQSAILSGPFDMARSKGPKLETTM